MEAVTNIKTVTSFGHDKTLLGFYCKKIAAPEKLTVIKANKVSIAFAISFVFMYFSFAVTFYTGALFLREYGVSAKDMFISIFAIMFFGMSVGKE